MFHDSLPPAILNAKEYEWLTPKQRKTFEQRLSHIEEVITAIKEFEPDPGEEKEFFYFCDDIELDLFAIHSLGDAKEDTSSWLLHSTWTSDLDGADLRQALAPGIKAALDEDIPGLSDNASVWIEWMKKQFSPLNYCLDAVYAANDFTEAVSYLVALDALSIKLLFGFCKVRLVWQR